MLILIFDTKLPIVSLKLSIFTTKKLVRTVHEPTLTVTLLETPMIGWIAELIAFVVPMNFSNTKPICFTRCLQDSYSNWLLVYLHVHIYKTIVCDSHRLNLFALILIKSWCSHFQQVLLPILETGQSFYLAVILAYSLVNAQVHFTSIEKISLYHPTNIGLLTPGHYLPLKVAPVV